MLDADQKRAAEVHAAKKHSVEWLKEGYWPEWRQALKSYKCERDAEIDPNEPNQQHVQANKMYDYQGRLLPAGRIDTTRTSIGMPDIWALTRRTVARVTAQIPNLKFRATDATLAERISRALMWQWDKGRVQRIQKKHVTQAVLFGWSVRPWYWMNDVYRRTRRVNPLANGVSEAPLAQIMQLGQSELQAAPDDMMAQIHQQYAEPLQQLIQQDPMMPHGQAMARLLKQFGRGGLLSVQYDYSSYVGPKTDFLFVGDCFPEPNFTSLQTSNRFIVTRRRNLDWVKSVAKAIPEFADGFSRLLTELPKGSPKTGYESDTGSDFRREAMSVMNRTVRDQASSEESEDREWIITEQHVPGSTPTLTLVADKNVFIGAIPYPYELEGKIAFTELVLIDDLLAGIGDSNARVLRGLQLLHDRQVNTRHDLVYNILRPLAYTTSQRLWDNPELVKRHGGMRLVKVDHASDIGVIGEQAAIASAAMGLNNDSDIMRMFQLGTGENNMSMAANVDPQQGRTATGARLLAYNQDILSKDLIDMFNESSLREDAWMMYMLNRSELGETLSFDAAPYNRQYGAQPETPVQAQVTEVTPEDFQIDGEVEPEVGSTLADDDEAKLTKAQTLWGIAASAPGLFNMQKAQERVLVALGEGRNLQEWAAPPPPPPPPPELKVSASISIKLEMLPLPVQQAILQQVMQGQIPMQAQPEGPPPMSTPPAGPPPNGMPMGAEALQAARGGQGPM